MKVRVGDLIEIKTGKGLVYAIYTHRHDKPPKYGALLRVFDEVYELRPDTFDATIKHPVRFSVFFPLQAAVNRGLVEVVATVQIPDGLRQFPLFRSGMVNPETKTVDSWWLWDGEREWRIGRLTQEQRKLSIRGVWHDTMLIQRIEEDWRPENDPSYS